MGTKYSALSVSGYNASPPPDDGSVSLANRVDWSKVKTKIGDPLNVYAAAVNTALVTAFDYGATEITEATAIGTTHNGEFCEVTTAVTLTLADASVLGASWYFWVKNLSGGTITLKRAASGNSIDGVVADGTLANGAGKLIAVNAALDGFLTMAGFGTGTGVDLSDTVAAALGAAAGAGVSTEASRQDHVHQYQLESFIVPVSDETTAITTGTAKVTFRMPYAFTLTAVRASLSTVSSSGTPTFDINESGSTILSTKITIDANEKTSTTAATPPVLSDTALADDAEITIDIDVAGTGAMGAKVTFIGRQA